MNRIELLRSRFKKTSAPKDSNYVAVGIAQSKQPRPPKPESFYPGQVVRKTPWKPWKYEFALTAIPLRAKKWVTEPNPPKDQTILSTKAEALPPRVGLLHGTPAVEEDTL